ncbi:phosphatase PAP2 family protein [Aliivibrio finisterrensis]|uniref:phosphatase PAP2 family protein n=1 Tax=Aliivibrio finisterrensis TaxID=511998 RepID=UPI0010208803|nr:phosphatase PAP2 family protein [Aliivibrio finisterrensis]RYU67015.1 phosphatase PAP2 family protein [Aliivibrio finisterrensis]RYU70241.1 phosphatase PAP2 family protein [Aliivibrio finisterrensis]RYU72379.1 phosphatase PAP2 family protein [Aliivibrio finisterrensis]
MFFSFSPKHRIYELIAFFLFISVMGTILLLTPAPDLFASLPPFENELLKWLSRSAGEYLFILTLAILCSIPIIQRLSIKKTLSLYLQFGILLVLSFMLKSGVKAITEIPRPYTQALVQVDLVDSTERFYSLDEDSKQALISHTENRVSPARIEQWRASTNYSFPSGHTIFAAICVLFWGGFLLRHKHYLLTTAVITWGVGVGFSRIWLGMHWPLDLIASIISASVLILCVPTICLEKAPNSEN